MLKFPQWSSLGMANNGLLYKLNFWFYGAILKVRKLSSRWKHDTPNKAQFTLNILMVNTKQSDTCLTNTLALGCFTDAANLESHLVQKLAVKASSLKISVAVFPCAIFLIITPCWYCQLKGYLISFIQIVYFVEWGGVAWLTLVEGFMKKRFVLPTIPVIIGTIVTILDQCFCTASPMCSPPHHHLLPH